MKCEQCYWTFDTQCVCESEETHSSATQYTDNCIGFLDKEFENKLWDTYEDCINLLSKRNLAQLLDIKSFILGQRQKTSEDHEPTEKEMLAYTE